MLSAFQAKTGSSHKVDNAGDDIYRPSSRMVLPFPARLRASHAKLKLRPPPPPSIPYTAPIVTDSGENRGDGTRARPASQKDHVTVDIPAYRLTLDGIFGGDERGGDDPGGGGKKRKVPASAVSGPFDQQVDSSVPSPIAATAPLPFVTRHHRPSIIARSHMFHRLLLARRKSQILTLQSDAADQLKKSSSKPENAVAAPLITDLMKSENLDLLWQSLDTIAVGKWPWDRMAWRGHAIIDDPSIAVRAQPESKKPAVGRWLSPIWRRRLSLRRPRTEIRRSGWIPEGSFELEVGSNISTLRRKNRQLLDQLRAYVQELLTVSLLPDAPTKRAIAAHKNTAKHAISASGMTAETAVKTASTSPETNISSSLGKFPESDASELDNVSNDAGSGGGKAKKKRKKKRSVLANNSNPHHVKNYVPSRTAPASLPDPTMSSVLSSLLLPMPNRFLAARPVGSSPEGPAKVGSDDFVCASCEYSLFFGSRESMLRAIAKRKRELRRRERVLRRARGLTEGRKPGTGGIYHGNDEDDEDWCDDDCRGCTCGGAARNREAREGARKGRIKDDNH